VKWDDWLELALVLAGAALLAVGQKLALPLLSDAGVAALGGALVSYGGMGILRREFHVGRRAYSRIYRGWAAVFFALAMLEGGVLFWVAAAARATGRLDVLIDGMLRRPGIPMLLIAVPVVCVGVARYIGPEPDPEIRQYYHRSFGGRLEASISLFMGMVLGAFGLFELILPGAFRALFHGLWDAFLDRIR